MCLKKKIAGIIVRMKKHPYQFAIDEDGAKSIMEVYDYEWTDEEI